MAHVEEHIPIEEFNRRGWSVINGERPAQANTLPTAEIVFPPASTDALRPLQIDVKQTEAPRVKSAEEIEMIRRASGKLSETQAELMKEGRIMTGAVTVNEDGTVSGFYEIGENRTVHIHISTGKSDSDASATVATLDTAKWEQAKGQYNPDRTRVHNDTQAAQLAQIGFESRSHQIKLDVGAIRERLRMPRVKYSN